MSENIEKITSQICEFYRGKNIFITGATGFVGICLIEKILRDLPDIGTLYLLMRPKKKKSIEERLNDLIENPIFERLLNERKEFYNNNNEIIKSIFKKLQPIHGDVGEDNLGISENDKQLLIDNVNVVIHSAATLDFFESLKTTTNINLKGTKRVMKLCDEIKNLKAMIHVSSAYVNSYLLEAEEILYPAPEKACRVIELVDSLSEFALRELEPRIIKTHPNPYTYTKHLAEHEVAAYAKKFPCGIIRPSMITAAWKEPVPGWTISKNGPQGFFMGASKGVIRRLPVNPSLIMDYIPVDVVVNEMLVMACHIATEKSKNPNNDTELVIYHCTSSTYKPFRFEYLQDQMNTYLHKYPLKSAVWYPNLKLCSSLLLFRISAIFFHFIPGFFLDLITKLSGGRPILIKLHTNVWNSLKTLERFIFTEWKFDNKKSLELAKTLNNIDKKKFYFDIDELRWDLYFLNMLLGVRLYLNNEKQETLEAARRKDRILFIAHVVLQILFYVGILFLIKSTFSLSTGKSLMILGIFFALFRKL